MLVTNLNSVTNISISTASISSSLKKGPIMIEILTRFETLLNEICRKNSCRSTRFIFKDQNEIICVD